MEYKQAKESISSYEYALLYKFSEIKLCKANEVEESDWVECMEARVFHSTEELHLFPQDEKTFVINDDMEYTSSIDMTYELDSNRFAKSGKSVTIRQYLKVDDDGQSYIAATRLLRVE